MSANMDTTMTTFDRWANPAMSEIQSLRDQNAVLQDRLDSSVAKIMKLQGVMNQITDGDVKKRFEALYGAIQDWVAEIELDLTRQSRDFREDFRGVLHYEEQEELLLNLGLREEDRNENGIAIWDAGSHGYEKMEWLGTLDTCISVVLSRYIWCRLNDGIFGTDYPLGLNHDAAKGLDYIVEAIEEDSNKEGANESCLRADKWRSEAIATLVPTKKFRNDKQRGIRDLQKSLFKDLSRRRMLLEPETLGRHIEALEANVLYPAAELQQAIACSSVRYEIIEPWDALLQPIREDGQLRDYTLKDVVHWRDRDPSKAIGGIFCCLFPGITRMGLARADDLPLVKPVVLVLDKETARVLQERGQMRDRMQHRLQRSPTKNEKARAEPSPISPRSSTWKSLGDSQHSFYRGKRDDARPEPSNSSGRFSLFSKFKSSRQAEERSALEAKARPGRRMSEDQSPKGMASKEAKAKARTSKRTHTATSTPSSSRKSSVSFDMSGTAMTSSMSSERYAPQRSQRARREKQHKDREEDVTPTNTVEKHLDRTGQQLQDTLIENEDEEEDWDSNDATTGHSSSGIEEDEDAERSRGEPREVPNLPFPVNLSAVAHDQGVDTQSQGFRNLKPWPHNMH